MARIKQAQPSFSQNLLPVTGLMPAGQSQQAQKVAIGRKTRVCVEYISTQCGSHSSLLCNWPSRGQEDFECCCSGIRPLDEESGRATVPAASQDVLAPSCCIWKADHLAARG